MKHITQAEKIERYDSVVKQRDRLDLAIHDILNDWVTWGSWITDNGVRLAGPAPRFRVGISRPEVYPLAIQVFRVAGQSDSIEVFDLEPWEADVLRHRANSECWEPTCQAIRSAKDALQKKQAAA